MAKKDTGSGRTSCWRGEAVLLLALGLLSGCDQAQNKFITPPPPTVGVSVPLQKEVNSESCSRASSRAACVCAA